MAEKKTNDRKKNAAKRLRQRSLKFNKRMLKIAAIIIVALVLIVLAFAKVGNITLSSITDSISAAFSGLGSGDGYPMEVSGGDITDIDITSSDLVMVYDDAVRIFDSTAKNISEISHAYKRPVADCQSGKILLFDIGGKNFRVQSKTRVLYEKTMAYMILTGAMGKDGSVAIASRTNGAESMLTVFDYKNREVFKWECSKEQIVACDISDNGKLYACAVLGVDNGSVYSKLYLFKKNEDKAYASFDYPDSSIAKVEFLSDDTLMVFGNDMCQIIEGEKVKEKIDVSVNTPSMLYVSEKNTAVLVLSKYSSTTEKIVEVYDKSGDKLFDAEVSGIIKSVSTDGKYIAVLTDKQVFIYDKEGEICGSHKVSSDASDVIVSSRYTYVYFTDKIEQYSSVQKD
ncbi:MAG: DUF5711 family protein [Clostridiales bacterium]|nr:DUF5711 family protein [Clostridiales bacterium]